MRHVTHSRGKFYGVVLAMATFLGITAVAGFAPPLRGPNPAARHVRAEIPTVATAQQRGEPDKVRNDEPQAPPAIMKGLKGTLPNDLQTYLNNGPAFKDFVIRKGWYGWDRKRKCIDHPDCANGAALGWMRIQAIEDAHTYPLSGLPATGLVIGRMSNVGLYTDATMHVPKAQNYWDEYYFVLKNNGSKTSAELWIALLSHDQKTGLPNKKMTIVKAANDFRPCAGHVARPLKPEGDFRDCSPHPATGAQGSKRAGRLASETEFAWFTCVDGCCRAQWPPLLLADARTGRPAN